jgi:hypothetical protein
LSSADVQRTAEGLGVDERTVWRWLAGPEPEPRQPRRDRYEITEAVRARSTAR